VNAVERERILRDAARRYILGEITYEEMTAIRRRIDAPHPARAPRELWHGDVVQLSCGQARGNGSRRGPSVSRIDGKSLSESHSGGPQSVNGNG
jgi:hypothetical protein